MAATGEDHPDQSERPGAATESDAVDSPAGDAGWFTVDPEGLERSDADQRGPAPSVSREANRDASGDRPALPSGPDLISAGMVHVDPEPGIDSPAGIGRPELAPDHGPDPRPDRPGGYEASGEPATAAGEVAGDSRPAPAVDAAPEVERRTGAPDAAPEAERSTGTPDAEPVPWTEPALPMPWPTSVEGRAGSDNERVSEDAESEQPPPPDPGWPRLFAVGAEATAARLEPGADSEADRQLAEHETPAADPVPADTPPTASAAPWDEQGPDETGGTDAVAVSGAAARTWPDASATDAVAADAEAARISPDDSAAAGDATDTAAARTRPRMFTGPGPDANLQDHDGAGPADADRNRAHTVGPAVTVAAGGQAGEDPTPATTGPAETGQMASGPPTSASGALSGPHANMAPAGLSNPSVSGETEGGGGVVNQRPENQSIEEDEAAIAVREAVSRAAAQAGVDVSRETAGDTLTGVPTPPGAVVEALGDAPRIDSATAARNARVTFKIHTDGVNGHGRILAVANQKGGVGKSTTAVNLGAYLALAGARILVVDLDPQGNASTGLGLDHREIEPSIYDVLTGETPPATAIRATTVANLHVLPSTIDLAGAEVELVSAMSREGRLRRALESIHHFYDTVLIDCPPSLGLLTVNALAAADELLIPIQCEYYALEGLGQLLRNVELVRANLNPELRIGGIVLTMYDGRTRLAEQVVAEVRKHFSDLVYQTVVPRSVRLSEAPGYGLPIALYDPLSRGGIAYRDLAFELAERSGLLAPTGEGAI